MEQNSATFDWTIYADATLAGLSALIPIPFLDGVSEDFFRRRMVPSIARYHIISLTPEAIAYIYHDKRGFWQRLGGCLLMPFTLTIGFLLQLSRKILYFLTVKKAVDALNYYWQRAYLLNHLIAEGHLEGKASVISADSALTATLAANSTSPLTTLARKITTSPFKIIRGLRRVLRGQDDATIEEKRSEISQAWGGFSDHFRNLRMAYDETYASQLAQLQVETKPKGLRFWGI